MRTTLATIIQNVKIAIFATIVALALVLLSKSLHLISMLIIRIINSM